MAFASSRRTTPDSVKRRSSLSSIHPSPVAGRFSNLKDELEKSSILSGALSVSPIKSPSQGTHRRSQSGSAMVKAQRSLMFDELSQEVGSFLDENNSLPNTSRVSFQSAFSPKSVSVLRANPSSASKMESFDHPTGPEKQREKEKTMLAYVQRLRADFDQERALVKELLEQERNRNLQTEAIKRDLERERTRTRQLGEKLFGARRDVDSKERVLQRALADMRAWKRCAEHCQERERILLLEALKATTDRVQEHGKITSFNPWRIVTRLTARKRIAKQVGIFERMNEQIKRLERENVELANALMHIRKEEQFLRSKEDLLFASESFLGANSVQYETLQDNHGQELREQLESSLLRSFERYES